jgi:hypothetical protein
VPRHAPRWQPASPNFSLPPNLIDNPRYRPARYNMGWPSCFWTICRYLDTRSASQTYLDSPFALRF